MLCAFFFLCLLLSQTIPANSVQTVGTEFVVAFPCMHDGAGYQYIFVTNANSNAASVTISSPFPNFTPIQKTVDATSSVQIQINDIKMAICDVDKVTTSGLSIQSNQPVSIYVDMEMTNGNFFTNYLALPTNMLGKQYQLSAKYSSNLVIATQDNTHITFANGQTAVTLNRLQVYWIPNSNLQPNTLMSNNPVAVLYSLNSYMSMSFDATMALPNNIKANEFPIVPDPKNTGIGPITVEIFALEDGDTTVMLNGQQQAVIQAGKSAVVQVSQPSIITTSKNTQVISGRQNSPYDPMAQIVPSNYFMSSTKVIFHPMAQTTSTYFGSDPFHTLLLIVPQASTGEISLDGTVIPALQYKRIPNSGYYYQTMTLSGAQHVLTTTGSNIKYTASIYTYSSAKFNVGLDLPLS